MGATELFIEQGKSTVWFSDTNYYTPATYGAVGVRYKCLEILQGGWSGVNNSRFASVSLGGRSEGKFFAEGYLGYARLVRPHTTQLDGHNQILVTFGIGGKWDNLYTTVRVRHFSNLNTQGKNHGFEVILLSGGVEF